MLLDFGYFNTTQTVNVPDKNLMGILRAAEIDHQHKGVEGVDYALENPIESKKLCELAQGKKKVAIIISDISRPCPSRLILPSLLKELGKAGVEDEQITVVSALGSHRHQTEEELRHLCGDEVFDRVRCIDSDPTDCIHMGDTKRGTPVDITRSVAEADFRIAVGNIEFHYFAGYSGGAKALMPGVSTPAAIEKNHRHMVNDEACAGNLIGNPIREDIEEAETMCHIDFILNVVLDEHKNIVFAVAGDVTAAHRAGCRYLDKMYRCPIEEQADIVLVSQGGAPKDANLYQTQKALDNSKGAVKEGGTIILIGACNEGFGSRIFEEWLTEAKCPEELTERVYKNFKLGGHKAAAIAMVLKKADIYLVSEFDPQTAENIFMKPFKSAQEAFEVAFAKYGPDAKVLAMPFAGSTLPILK